MTNYTARKEQGAKMTRDVDGKFAPKFQAAWLAADAAKAERLSNRTFASKDVELAAKYGTDADELFA